MDYKTLNNLPPEAFLNPENFRTCFDKSASYALEQFEKGKEVATENSVVGIASGGTWFAEDEKGITTSYEGIGYHAHTADLLRGLLTCKRFVVCRNDEKYERVDGQMKKCV